MLIGNILLDLILLALVILGFYLGWKRGFLATVLKTFAGLFSAVIAMTCFGTLAPVIKERYVYGFVHQKIGEALEGLGANSAPDTLTDAIPSGLRDTAALVGIDLNSIAESAVREGQNAVQQFAESATDSIAQLIASAAAFVILFLVSLFVLRVLSTPISAIVMRIPVVGQINRFLGLLFGGAAALILAWIAVLLVAFLDGSLSLEFIEVPDAWLAGVFYRFSIFS